MSSRLLSKWESRFSKSKTMLSSNKDRGPRLQASGRLVLLVTIPFIIELMMWWVAGLGEARSRRVERTLRVQISLERLEVDFRNAGYSQRGFRATGEQHFLNSYEAAVSDARAGLSSLTSLTADNPNQIQNLAGLKPLVDRYLEQLDSGVRQSRIAGSAAKANQYTAEQQDLIDSIESAIGDMYVEEEQLLKQQQAALARAEFGFRYALFASYALIVAIVMSLNRSVKRHRIATAAAQARLSSLNAELDERVKERTALLHAREELLNTFVTHVPAAVAMFDRDMRYLQVSGRWCTDYGFLREEFLGHGHYDLFPDLPDKWREIHGRCLAGEHLRDDEDRWERADGSVMWRRWEVRPWGSRDGLPEGVLIFSEDITERKRIEEQLRESEATTRTLLETASQAILAVDLEGRIVIANRKTNEMFGYSRDELLGRWHEILIPKKLRERHRAHLANFNADPKSRSMGTGMDLVGLRKDGTEFPIEVSLSRVDTKRGPLAVSFVSDITDRKRAEKDLVESERKLRALAGSLLTAQEEERRNLARELHDGVTQELGFLSVELGRIAAKLPRSSETQQRVLSLQQQAMRTSSDLRRLSHGLHPSVIADFGLAIALEIFALSFREPITCAWNSKVSLRIRV